MNHHLTTESYREGYRNGRADRLLGWHQLRMALTSSWGFYAAGYKAGYIDTAFEKERERKGAR